jgi:hypothetical protein
MKQSNRRFCERTLTKRSEKVKEPFHYVSQELNKMAANFHAEQVCNKPQKTKKVA